MENNEKPISWEIPEVASSDITQLTEDTYRLVGSAVISNYWQVGGRVLVHVDDGNTIASEVIKVSVNPPYLEFKVLD